MQVSSAVAVGTLALLLGGADRLSDPPLSDPTRRAQERPQSPPWHHTNPLARIHPDWEEAAVLTRIMDKLGTKGGGRRRRERRLGTVAREMQGKYAKESGPRPALLFQ